MKVFLSFVDRSCFGFSFAKTRYRETREKPTFTIDFFSCFFFLFFLRPLSKPNQNFSAESPGHTDRPINVDPAILPSACRASPMPYRRIPYRRNLSPWLFCFAQACLTRESRFRLALWLAWRSTNSVTLSRDPIRTKPEGRPQGRRHKSQSQKVLSPGQAPTDQINGDKNKRSKTIAEEREKISQLKSLAIADDSRFTIILNER